MLLSRREDLKAKLAGGAAALAIEAGFISVLLFGLSVSYVKTPPRTMAIKPINDTVIKETPPADPKPFEQLLPNDFPPPPIDIIKPDKPIDPIAPPDLPTGGDTAAFNGGGIDPIVLPEKPIDPPPVIRLPPGMDQRYASYLQPSYPAAARRADMEGRVELRVLVGIDGRIKAAEVKRSSGHEILDQAAIEHALKKWRFKPATQDGKPIEGWLLVPISFELNRA
jgi:periplasmic protein TonB